MLCKRFFEMLDPNMIKYTSGKLGEMFVAMLGLGESLCNVLCAWFS